MPFGREGPKSSIAALSCSPGRPCRMSRLPVIGFSTTLPCMNPAALTSEKDAALAQRMAALGVRETDLEESFVRSGGHGGQNVNKTSTCVMLLHRPTGVQVKCQSTRQQGFNRVLARRVLL